MNAYRLETTVQDNGTVMLENTPYPKGTEVEVIVLPRKTPDDELAKNKYPLRGTPYTFSDPFEPVAIDDWEALK